MRCLNLTAVLIFAAFLIGCNSQDSALLKGPDNLTTPDDSTPNITAQKCEQDSDCPENKPLCIDKVCTQKIKENEDCAITGCDAGYVCKDSVCVPSSETPLIPKITLPLIPPENLVGKPVMPEPKTFTVNIKDKLIGFIDLMSGGNDAPDLFYKLEAVKLAPAPDGDAKVSRYTRLFAQFNDKIDCAALSGKSPFVLEKSLNGSYVEDTDSIWKVSCGDDFVVATNSKPLEPNTKYKLTLPVDSVKSPTGKKLASSKSAFFTTLDTPTHKRSEIQKIELMRALVGPQQNGKTIYPNDKVGSDPFHGQIAIFDAENIMVAWLAYTAPENETDNRTHVVIGHYNSVNDTLRIAEPANDTPDADTSKGSAHHQPSVFFDQLGYGYVTYFASHAWQGDGPPDGSPRNPVGFTGPIMKKSLVPFPKKASDWGPQVRGRMNGSNCDEIVTTISAANGNTIIACGNTGAWIDEIAPCKEGKICWVGNGARQVLSNDRTPTASPADGLVYNRMSKAKLFADRNPLGAQKLFLIWGYSGALSMGSFDNAPYGTDHHRVYFAYSDDYGKTWKSHDYSEDTDGSVKTGKRFFTKEIPADQSGLVYSNEDPSDCKIKTKECSGPISPSDKAFALTQTRSTRYKTLFAADDGTIYIAFNKSLFLDRGSCTKLVKCNAEENGCFSASTCELTSDGHFNDTASCVNEKAYLKCGEAKDDAGNIFTPDMSKAYGVMMLAKFKLGANEPINEYKVSVGAGDRAYTTLTDGIPGTARGVGGLYANGDKIRIWYPIQMIGLNSIEEATSVNGGKNWAYENFIEKNEVLNDAGIQFAPGTLNGVTEFRPTWIFGVTGSDDFYNTMGMAYGVGYTIKGIPNRLAKHGVHYYQMRFDD